MRRWLVRACLYTTESRDRSANAYCSSAFLFLPARTQLATPSPFPALLESSLLDIIIKLWPRNDAVGRISLQQRVAAQ
jgi:hypothetical protein